MGVHWHCCWLAGRQRAAACRAICVFACRTLLLLLALRYCTMSMKQRHPSFSQRKHVSSLKEHEWNVRLKQLKSFQEQHGHVKVVAAGGRRAGLGRWLRQLRSQKRRGKLPEEHKKSLEELGVGWDTDPDSSGQEEEFPMSSSSQQLPPSQDFVPPPQPDEEIEEEEDDVPEVTSLLPPPRPKRPRKPSKRKSKRRRELWAPRVNGVLRAVHPDLSVSSRAQMVLESAVLDIMEQLSMEAGKLARYTGKKTLQPLDLAAAVKFILPGELAKHADAEGRRAVHKFESSE